jgi:tetratricopeptide (TPR) repeat protein
VLALALILSTRIPVFGGPESSVLFLSSTPIGAQVLYDEEMLEGVTPLLLRELPPGRHVFELRKAGYSYRRLTVTLRPGQVESVAINLGGEYLLPSFPEEGIVAIQGTEEAAEDRLFQIPQGTYRITREQNGTLQIRPLYPLQGWLTGLDIALPLAFAFSGVLTAHDAVYPKRASLPITDEFSLSAASLSAYGVTLALLGFDIALHVSKARHRRAFSYTAVSAQESPHMAREYFDRAESLLSLGQLEEAQRFYTVILERYRSSPLYPEALFKIARIHAVSGDQTMAEMELDLLVERYPTPGLYDKARKALADLALARGEYEESLVQLDAMVFADPLFAPEDIEQSRAEILGSWAAVEPSVLPRVTAAYERLIERYPDSEQIPRYRFALALHLHELGRNEEAASQLTQIDPERVDSLLAERIRDLLADIEGGG